MPHRKCLFARPAGYLSETPWPDQGKGLSQGCINSFFAQDFVNDPWYPLGNGNMMNILNNGIHMTHVASYDEVETAFDLVIHNGAKATMLEDPYCLEVGKPANFIVVSESSVFEAIRKRVEVLASVRNSNFLSEEENQNMSPKNMSPFRSLISSRKCFNLSPMFRWLAAYAFIPPLRNPLKTYDSVGTGPIFALHFGL